MPGPTVLSMIIPLVPPAAARAATGNGPALIQVTVPSVMVAPGVVGHDGAVEPEVPVT